VGEQGRRERDAERLGGLEVDHEFVLRRRLYRQVGRLLAFKNAIDVAGGETIRIDGVITVGDQPAGGGEVAFIVDRGQPIPRRQRR
jgi:hypothetical protein